MRIAVTGGLGRLGRYVVRGLTQHTVRVLDIGARADCHPADLRDLDALRAGLRGVEVVVHLGGIDRSVATDDAATMQVNAMGTWNLFEASLQTGVRRVIHCSSSSVLGLDHSNPDMPPCYLPIDEAHPLRPTDAYGLSKLCGERIAEAYLAARRRGDRHPSLLRRVPRHGGLHGRQTRTGRAAANRCRICAPMSGRRTARAASLPRRRSSMPASRHSSSPPMMRSPTEPTIGRLEALYGTPIPLRDAALYRQHPECARRSATRRQGAASAGRRRHAGRQARSTLDCARLHGGNAA